MLTKAQVKDLSDLHVRKIREERGEFLAEGPVLVAEALKYATVRKLIYYEGDADQPETRWVLEQARLKSIVTWAATNWQFEKFCEAQAPQLIAAVVEMLPNRGQEMLAAEGPLVILDEIQDPGNVGALVRTAAAFAMAGVIASDGSADLFQAKTARASEGGIFKVPLAWQVQPWLIIPELLARGFTIYGCTAHASADDFHKVEFPPKSVLILGNERRGIRHSVLDQCSRMMRIPMHRATESLNVSVAGAVIMHHLYSQRQP